jgi:cytochrome c553
MRDSVGTLGLAAVGLVVLASMGWASTWFISDSRLSQRLNIPIEAFVIPTDLPSLQRGQHLAGAVAGCSDCHGANLAGKVVVDDPLLMRITAPNLTRGHDGVGSALSDADLARAIRHGVDAEGHPLLLMPDSYYAFSNEDLAAIVAYIRAVPPVDTALPATVVRPVGRALLALGQLPLLPATTADRLPRSTPRPAVSAEYGKYLADAAGCPGCHGPGLSGGPIPGAPPGAVPASNLTTTALGAWSEADFVRTMRSGIDPDGHRLTADMRWPVYAQMTDDELRSLWFFLQAIPARATGSR